MNGRPTLRVCILIPRIDLGGAEVQVINQLRAFDRSTLKVSLCCLSPGNAEMEDEARRYVDALYHLDFRWRFLAAGLLRLVRYLRNGKFDVIHCHMPPADLIGRTAAWLAGVPVRITTEHGRGLWKSWAYVTLEKILNNITDLRICVSRDILEIRARREATPREKLEYLPNGVDLDEFKSPDRDRAGIMEEFGWDPEDPLVLSLGRLVREKNYPLLVESIASVRNRIPAVRCIIAGEGECRDEITSRIHSLDAGRNVRLAGIRSDIPDLLYAADVFVLSSIREGFPVSLIEAMASGKAIAATDVGGIPDAIVNGKNGLLVRPEDADALAGAIETLVRDRDLRFRMGEAALLTAAERFSLAYVAERTKEIYLDLHRRKTGWIKVLRTGRMRPI